MFYPVGAIRVFDLIQRILGSPHIWVVQVLVSGQKRRILVVEEAVLFAAVDHGIIIIISVNNIVLVAAPKVVPDVPQAIAIAPSDSELFR
jgi:hypothetical protein